MNLAPNGLLVDDDLPFHEDPMISNAIALHKQQPLVFKSLKLSPHISVYWVFQIACSWQFDKAEQPLLVDDLSTWTTILTLSR